MIRRVCPFFRKGIARSHCDAYLGEGMPSLYEEEYLCRTCSHSMCVWFVSMRKGVTDERFTSPDSTSYIGGDVDLPAVSGAFLN